MHVTISSDFWVCIVMQNINQFNMLELLKWYKDWMDIWGIV